MTPPPQARGGIPKWTFGDRVRKARQHAGLTQIELAQAIDVAPSTLGTWESPGGRKPHDIVDTAERIAQATGVDADWLLRGTERERPQEEGDETTTKRVGWPSVSHWAWQYGQRRTVSAAST